MLSPPAFHINIIKQQCVTKQHRNLFRTLGKFIFHQARTLPLINLKLPCQRDLYDHLNVTVIQSATTKLPVIHLT